VTRIHHFESTDSTNERAFAALDDGEARDGDVFVAAEQTAGRGRQGRVWESARGEGLYASVIHRPALPAPHPAALTMAAGLAILDATREVGLETARLDWPNDLVVGQAKLAGILVESRGLDPKAPTFVIGFGVNVGQRSFPAALTSERAVTSLALEGVEATPEVLLELLLPRLGARLAETRESAELCQAYLAATGLANRGVLVRVGQEELSGLLLELDLESGLGLETGGGIQRLELAHVRELRPLL